MITEAIREMNRARYMSGEPLLAPTIGVSSGFRIVWCPWCKRSHAHDMQRGFRGGIIVRAPCQRESIIPEKAVRCYEIGPEPSLDSA